MTVLLVTDLRPQNRPQCLFITLHDHRTVQFRHEIPRIVSLSSFADAHCMRLSCQGPMIKRFAYRTAHLATVSPSHSNRNRFTASMFGHWKGKHFVHGVHT